MIENDPVIADSESVPPDADTVEEEDAETPRPDTGPEPSAPESPDSEPVPTDDDAELANGLDAAAVAEQVPA